MYKHAISWSASFVGRPAKGMGYRLQRAIAIARKLGLKPLKGSIHKKSVSKSKLLKNKKEIRVSNQMIVKSACRSEIHADGKLQAELQKYLSRVAA